MGGSKLKEFIIERVLTDEVKKYILEIAKQRDGLKVSGQVELNK